MIIKSVKKSILVYCVAAIILLIFALPQNASAEERKLVPVGRTVGVTARLCGVCVINVTEFKNTEGDMCSPAKEAGLCAQDKIMSIGGKEINSAAELEKACDNSSGNKITLEVLRDGNREIFDVTPVKSADDNKYRIGVWIKDSSSGIGTLTYYDPQTGEFGALGHGICDENNTLIEINEGDILDAEITSVVRGEKGMPGELIALFSDNSLPIGIISCNTSSGIFGKLTEGSRPYGLLGEIPVATRDEVEEDEATILSNVEGESVTEYTAEIDKINKDKNSTKGMIIKITDDRLIDKTGGIVRGLSGSPIIQNGKIVGAVTHVFVNDPSRGYGIFIENMLETQKN